MAESAENLPVPARAGIFEVNLLGDRVQRMHRRVRFFQICSVLALMMVVAGGIFSALTARNLIGYVRASQGRDAAATRLAEAISGEAELDRQRQEACDALGNIGALAPIARRRVAWAPKLAALAQAVPAGGGILDVEAQSGEIFWEAPAPKETVLDKMGRVVPPAAVKRPTPPSMKFSVVYGQALAGGNLMQLLDRLQQSEAFMKQMGSVHLDATVEEAWMGSPARVLSGSCKGVEEVKP